MKLLKKIMCMMMVLCLAVSAAGLNTAYAAQKDYFPEVNPDTTPYGEMSIEPIDGVAYQELCDEIDALISETTIDAQQAAEKFEELFEMFFDAYYLCNILYNYTCLYPTNQDYAQQYNQANEAQRLFENELIEIGHKLLACAAGDEIAELLPETYVEYVEMNEPYTEEQLEINAKIDELLTEYNELSVKNYTIEIDGEEYDIDELYDMYLMGEISGSEYNEYADEIFTIQAETMFENYIALVEQRTLLSETYGYENAYDYFADNYFRRGASREQIEVFKAGVEEYLAYISAKVDTVAYYSPRAEQLDPECMSVDYDMDEALDDFAEQVKSISTEIYDTYEFMKDADLIDMVNSGNRVPTTYTTSVDANKPYIQNGYGNEYINIATRFFHELGHANMSYYFENTPFDMLDYDLAEVHSTSLEVLALPFYGERFSEDVQSAVELDLLNSMLSTITICCMYDSLEQYIYIEGARDLHDISTYFMDQLKLYGYADPNSPVTENYSWIQISHIFLSPCYQISYAHSSYAALQIFIEMKEDYDSGVEIYLNLCSEGFEYDYEDAITRAGLATPFDLENLELLAESIDEEFELDAKIEEIRNALNPPQPDYKVYKIKSGDTLSKIAADHKVDMEEIVALNSIENPSRIYAGDLLILPENAVMQKAEYTIQPGDTLYEIAKAFDASMESIAQQNGIEDMTRIYAGEVLVFEY